MVLCVCVRVSCGEQKKDHRSRVVYTVASHFPLWLSKTFSQRNMTDVKTRTRARWCACAVQCAAANVRSCQPAHFQPVVQSFLYCGEPLSSTVFNFT